MKNLKSSESYRRIFLEMDQKQTLTIKSMIFKEQQNKFLENIYLKKLSKYYKTSIQLILSKNFKKYCSRLKISKSNSTFHISLKTLLESQKLILKNSLLRNFKSQQMGAITFFRAMMIESSYFQKKNSNKLIDFQK